MSADGSVGAGNGQSGAGGTLYGLLSVGDVAGEYTRLATRAPDLVRLDAADLRGHLGRVVGDQLAQVFSQSPKRHGAAFYQRS